MPPPRFQHGTGRRLIAASGLLLVCLAVGGFAWWLNANREKLREKGVAAQTEGEHFGTGKTSEACVDQSVMRLDRESGIVDQAMLELFLKACLESASRDPKLCVGVPATNEIFASASWRESVCAAHGKSNDQSCARLLTAIQEVCHAAH
jgi:hypothetical protein